MPKAVLGIRPTRIELLKLRRREIIAQKGHDLLQEKLDAMIIQLQTISDKLNQTHQEIIILFKQSYSSLSHAAILSGYSALEEISGAIPEMEEISMGTSRIVGVRVPVIQDLIKENTRGYSYFGTNGQIDTAVEDFSKLLTTLIRHAEIVGTAHALTREISSCRRRVNALEQIIIPSLANTQRYIEMRLEEREREDLFRRKRTKQLQQRNENSRK